MANLGSSVFFNICKIVGAFWLDKLILQSQTTRKLRSFLHFDYLHHDSQRPCWRNHAFQTLIYRINK